MIRLSGGARGKSVGGYPAVDRCARGASCVVVVFRRIAPVIKPRCVGFFYDVVLSYVV